MKSRIPIIRLVLIEQSSLHLHVITYAYVNEHRVLCMWCVCVFVHVRVRKNVLYLQVFTMFLRVLLSQTIINGRILISVGKA